MKPWKLFKVQRAFIFPTPGVSETRASDGKQNGIKVEIVWQNAGSTSTKNLIIHRDDSNQQMAGWNLPNIKEENLPRLSKPKDLATFIGPKQSIVAPEVIVIPAELWLYIFNGKHYKFWGEARYSDVFTGTDTHITRYCYEVIVMEEYSAVEQPRERYSPQIQQCEGGNRTDKECGPQ